MLVQSTVEHNYLVVDVCCLLHRYQLHVSAIMAIFRLNELTKNLGSYIWHASYIWWRGFFYWMGYEISYVLSREWGRCMGSIVLTSVLYSLDL